MNNAKSLLLATAAATLFLSGSVLAAEGTAASEAKVHCTGINACKGTSECKTATNACKGKNSCKGQGWVTTTKAKCDAKGGREVG